MSVWLSSRAFSILFRKNFCHDNNLLKHFLNQKFSSSFQSTNVAEYICNEIEFRLGEKVAEHLKEVLQDGTF